MKMLIAAALFTLALAAPVAETKPHSIAARDPFTCPGGLTNSTPMCCSVNVLGLLALDCQQPGANGCSGSSKPNCCTLGAAGQGVICNAL